MKPGEKFEIECYEHLKKNYQTDGVTFEHEGGMNSTKSDIRVLKGGKEAFYIEAKDAAAHSGQFVVLADEVNKIFQFSPRNKSEANEITELIIQYMNQDFAGFSKAGTAGKTLDIDKKIFQDWIVGHYRQKNVKYVISKAMDFVFFPLDKFGQYFDISANYRIKGSGTSTPAKRDMEAVMQLFRKHYPAISFRQDGKKLFATASTAASDERYVLGKYHYFLSSREKGEYEVRRRSNTRNMTILFQIKLVKAQAAEDLAAFQKSLKD